VNLFELTIFEKIPSWNTIISLTKKHWSQYAEVKRYWKELIQLSCAVENLKPIDKFPVTLQITVNLSDNRLHDLDNYAVKLITDGLVFAEIIPDDNIKYINKLVIDYKKSDKEFDYIDIILKKGK
jgi:hypothetical protein